MHSTAARLAPFGKTVFATWNRLATEYENINLGQDKVELTYGNILDRPVYRRGLLYHDHPVTILHP